MEQNKITAKRPLALITGASSGIGLELSRVFAKNGFDLVMVAEDAGIFSAAKQIQSDGTKAEALQINLAENGGVEELFTQIETQGKVLDTVCLNAGVGVGGAFSKTDMNAELNMINLNIISVVKFAKLIVPVMISRGHGRILFTSSLAAEMPGPYYAVYAATKAFVQSFAEALRFELVEHKGITITALQPGATDTNFFARANMLDTPAGKSKKDDPAEVAEQAFKALMDERDHVVSGSIKNNIQAGMARLMPETMQSKLHATSTKPNSENH